jgi:hypothetical protein
MQLLEVLQTIKPHEVANRQFPLLYDEMGA